ncbi:MAG: sarcosine oxidase subunit delta [Rhizobiaceae bacterium]|nr:sarcosine oxidase subunit delta [Rhizobiaceae bacterium]
MLLIHCPYCFEERPEIEFRQSGEAHLARPEGSAEIDDRTIAEMLYFRSNGRGVIFERWRHVHGCGRFFNAARHAVTDAFLGTYAAGLAKPEVSAEGLLVFAEVPSTAAGGEPIPGKPRLGKSRSLMSGDAVQSEAGQ